MVRALARTLQVLQDGVGFKQTEVSILNDWNHLHGSNLGELLVSLVLSLVESHDFELMRDLIGHGEAHNSAKGLRHPVSPDYYLPSIYSLRLHRLR